MPKDQRNEHDTNVCNRLLKDGRRCIRISTKRSLYCNECNKCIRKHDKRTLDKTNKNNVPITNDDRIKIISCLTRMMEIDEKVDKYRAESIKNIEKITNLLAKSIEREKRQ